MATADINYFDILSNEIIAGVVSLLDLDSLFRLARTSKQLSAFKEISNEQWRRYYAQRWLVEDKELALYSNHNWQKQYQDRLKSESDYLLWLKNAAATQSELFGLTGEDKLDAREPRAYRKVPKTDNTTEEGIYYEARVDPWAVLLRANSENPPQTPTLEIKAALRQIAKFFYEPFTVEDTKREMMSGRFDIVVTTISKYAAEDINILKEVKLFRSYFADENKDRRTRPIGLLGLLAKYLDLTLPSDVLLAVLTSLWEIASSKLLDDEFFVGLEIIQKVSNILLKSTDPQVKHTCVFVITWFDPAKPENKKFLVNGPLMRYFIDRLADESAEDLRWVLQLVHTFGVSNSHIVDETRVIHKIMDLARDKFRDNNTTLSYLLNTASDLCLTESTECCIELAQDEAALEYIFSLLRDSQDEGVRKVTERALNLIDTIARNGVGAERLIEMNALDKLLPFIEDPTNTHLFRDLYYAIKYITAYGARNGFGDEIFPKLLEHKDALLTHGYNSPLEATQSACDEFWMTFSCAVNPPRDVSIKLIDRAMPLVVDEKTKLATRIDAAILLANLVEIDIALFENKQLTPLFNYLAEYLINFDAEKEDAELRKQRKEIEKVVEAEEVEDEGPLEDQDSDESEDDEAAECPWPLNLLAQIVRFDYLKDLAIQNERLIEKLFSMHDDDTLEYEGHFLAMYVFSLLIHKPGWDSARALECIEDFAIEAAYDVEWNFVFALLAPYAHLLKKDNPTPLVIFGSWFLAHMSTTEAGRQVLKKELDPEVLKWMKTYPHARVEYNMTHFNRNMQKKSRRKQ
eukprot:TRINITY_DN1829_c0_g1_i2.p1 TRINITY_DN1829_c0_g1~~TRINITY_DN1829_c0_g1_i2.p1  ORF type:complete len:803 (-),score=143.99 TRINITY_DN1829_c0_g1_i2:68-2476(-)